MTNVLEQVRVLEAVDAEQGDLPGERKVLVRGRNHLELRWLQRRSQRRATSLTISYKIVTSLVKRHKGASERASELTECDDLSQTAQTQPLPLMPEPAVTMTPESCSTDPNDAATWSWRDPEVGKRPPVPFQLDEAAGARMRQKRDYHRRHASVSEGHRSSGIAHVVNVACARREERG